MRDKNNQCLSCQSSLKQEEKYCPACGQRTRDFNLSISSLSASFAEAFFNFDNKIVRTLKDLYKPNRITHAFIQGDRKTYVHPFKILFICLIVLFFVISQLTKDVDLTKNNSFHRSVLKMEQSFKIDSLAKKGWLTSDSLVDSLKLYLLDKNMDPTIDSFDFDMTIYENYTTKYGVTVKDALTLNDKEIFEKYAITSFFDRLFVSQMIRTSRDLNATIRFFINNMLWGIVLMLFLGSFFSYLLYYRHDTFYQEHVFLFSNFFTTTFIPLSCALFVKNKIFPDWNFEIPILLISFGYFTYCLKMYFHQNWIKTIVKSMTIFISLFFIFILVIIIIFLISIVMF